MPRQPLLLALPPLATLQTRFQEIHAAAPARAALIQWLREVIKQVRGGQRQLFYPQGNVAQVLGLSRRTVHLAYQQLQAEGLLSCLRGSATYLHGHRLQPRHPPRAVVGLPVWVGGFSTFPDWRLFYTAL